MEPNTEDGKDFEMAQRMNKDHGRIETGTLTVSNKLKDFLDWRYLQRVFKLERQFISTQTGKIQHQFVYGCTSLSRSVFYRVMTVGS